jgi:hypothetical protein
VTPADPDTVVFAGRIGTPRSVRPAARSVRRPLAELLAPAAAD